LSKRTARKGTPYSGDNLYIYPKGSVHEGDRGCRACSDAAHKRFLERKSLQRLAEDASRRGDKAAEAEYARQIWASAKRERDEPQHEQGNT
jgi:hypothetical protein